VVGATSTEGFLGIMTRVIRVVCSTIDGDAGRDGGVVAAAKDAGVVARGVATPSLCTR